MSREVVQHPDRVPGLAIVFGVLFALIFTLIFLMIEQAITDFRKWKSKPVRVDPVVPQFLDNGVFRRGRLGDSRPRIGKRVSDV